MRTGPADTRTKLDAEEWTRGLVEALLGWQGLRAEGGHDQTGDLRAGRSNNKQTNKQTKKQKKTLTKLAQRQNHAGLPSFCPVEVEMEVEVAQFSIQMSHHSLPFYSLHFVVIKHPEILKTCT